MFISQWRAAWMCCAAGMLAACASNPKIPPPSTDIDETGFRIDVRMLASDEFEGRKPGTSGEDKTVGFLVDQFKKLGLKPGNGDSYIQQVPLVEITANDATLTITGRGPVASLVYGRDMVIWSHRETAAPELKDSQLVFAGYGIVAPEYHWNDYAQTDVRGKTVLVMVSDPGHGSKDPKTFRGNAQTRYGSWTYKVEEAARQGAAGVLLIHDTGAAGYGWDVVVNGHAGPELSRAATADSAGRVAIEGWISAQTARGLFEQAALDFAGLAMAASRPGFKAVAMGLRVNAGLHDTVRQITSANVIALLPGTDRRREYVVYTAHWDHLGRQTVQAGGAVYGGAVDNASGVAGLLMLAQSFKRTHPGADRSIVFMAFTAGEADMLGSAYYVEHPVFPLRDTAAVLNMDMLHIGGPTRDVAIIGYGNSELEDYVREAADLQGRETHPDPNPELGMYFRSDQFNFARSGVPALYVRGGVDDSARGPVWGQAQAGEYLARRYHQTTDKYSPAWDVRGALDDLRLYYAIGNRIARTRRFPRWYPNSEFASRHGASDGPDRPEVPEGSD